MILAVTCEGALNNIFYVVKNIMNIIMIVTPILAILMFSILLLKMTFSPEDKKLIKNLTNSLKAMVIIFFIPMLLTLVMYALGESNDVSKCYLSASKMDTNSKYNNTLEKDKKKNEVINDPRDYEKGNPRQLDFSCKSNIIKANFSCETIHIVENHLNDFNYYTFNSVMSRYGGFKNYTKSLGGIFEDYYGKKLKVTKVYEFQRASEYVFGYMTMYGFDYYNGKQCNSDGHNCTGKWCKWGGGCMTYEDILYNNKLPSPATSDAFYPGQMLYDSHGLSDKKHFDKIVDGSSNMNMTTNCNWAVDMVYYKAGIFGTGRVKTNSSANYTGLYKTAKKVIYQPKDLEVGDILAFFHSQVKDGSSPSSWGSWYHAAYVGETHKDEKDPYVVIYDGGSRITYNRSHKWTMKLSSKDRSWVGFRVIELE